MLKLNFEFWVLKLNLNEFNHKCIPKNLIQLKITLTVNIPGIDEMLIIENNMFW